MRCYLFGEDLSVESEDPKIKWLQWLRSEEDLVNGNFDLLDFDLILCLCLVISPDLV